MKGLMAPPRPRVELVLGLERGDLSGDGGSGLIQAHERRLILRTRWATGSSFFYCRRTLIYLQN
jgi:hypothetical protein